MENNIDLRFDLSKIFDGYKSIIILALNYYQPIQKNNIGENISIYAYGRDYHKTIKGKLKKIINFLKENDINARGFTDSAPILEKYFAENSGIGWQGKNSLIINKNLGSYFFLAEILTDFNFGIYNNEIATNHCGKCTKCIDACPTNAIIKDKVIDSNKCISYLTIEHSGSIKLELENQMENLVFGCDICQSVCPWNKKSVLTTENDFNFRYDGIQIGDALNLNEDEFDKLFNGSPIKRAGFDHFKNQIERLIKSS
jgi:epoxyqueuosine reductase